MGQPCHASAMVKWQRTQVPALTSRARFCSIPAAEDSAVGRRGSSPHSTDARNWRCYRSEMRRPGASSPRSPKKGAANVGGSYSAMARHSRVMGVRA